MNIPQLYTWFRQSTGITTDTRKVEKDNLFFALKGDHFNGNQFATQAIEKGALAAVVDEPEFADESQNIFLVENGLETLQYLAKHHRTQLGIPIISMTGSNGKTTTKELISCVLRKKYSVWNTQGNLNNHIGVPLTLLSIKPSHEMAVVEMGANHLKEIEELCKIALPDYGYITNFGKAHLEGFGGEEGVIKGKSELYHYLKSNQKTAFVNADDAKQIEMSKGIERISFGKNNADYVFSELMENGFVGLKYQNEKIQSNLVGAYNFTNLCAAVSIGLYFGISISQIQAAIHDYVPSNNRSQILKRENLNILLDAYNANPSSMEAAIHNFASFEGKKTAILGDMFELGKNAKDEHQRIAQLAAESKINQVIVIGEEFNQTEISNIQKFATREAFVEYLKNNPIHTDWLLIKGSRGMALEKLLDVV